MARSAAARMVCVQCGESYPLEANPMTCHRCGPSGTLDFETDWRALSEEMDNKGRSFSPGGDISQYFSLLPRWFSEDALPLPVGGTPLIASPRLRERCELPNLWIKDESRQPSASLKDRASLVAAFHARSLGVSRMATASTGNAASSLATICAALGMEAVIFVPEAAPRPKLVQLQLSGAKLLPVQGTYDDAFDLCFQACQAFGWYNRSTGINPYCAEGKKTCALEIWNQLGGRVPDRVLVSVGDGCILAGLYKGFRDLTRLGWVDRMPRLYGVQAEGSSVIARGYREGKTLHPLPAKTYADSISVSRPADYRKAWRAVEQTRGDFILVSDDEIREAVRILASRGGIFGEPSGAASLAGLEKLRINESIAREEWVVCVMTGSGLKDITGAMSAAAPSPRSISPDLNAVERALGEARE